MKVCKIDGCHNPYYAKGFCHNHYELNRRNGIPFNIRIREVKCSVAECQELATRKMKLCSFHLNRKRVGIPLDLPRGSVNVGSRNAMWKGGVSDYPNHYRMKVNRKAKLQSVNYVCEDCGGTANEVHHRDESRTNHAIENLKAVCHKCHAKYRRKNYSSKYRRLYGYTLNEMRKFRPSKLITIMVGNAVRVSP